VVVELCGSADELRAPETEPTRPPYALSPRFEFARERLYFLARANNYDDRAGRMVWGPTLEAQRLGATPSDQADVLLAEGTPAWCDGGPRAGATRVPEGHALVHRNSLEQRLLEPDRPVTTNAALAADQLKYRFEGLIGFEDPVRADVPGALAEARHAGVSVAMITGDFPATALAAAKAVGISTSAGVISGAELAGRSPVPPDARIFARIDPEQKLRLVQHFRDFGQVVAMTGDGINDAPALAAADIGIAMGQRGTDVAREASDLILLDDRFASIVGGVRLGRRIFANLRRAMTYITAVHVPVAGLALLPILLGLPPLLYPMHLVLLELLIDPLCSIVFETEPSEPDSMRKPPRRRDEPLFGWSQISFAVLEGLVLLAAVLFFYILLLYRGEAEGGARAAAFTSLFVGHLTIAVAAIASNSTKLLVGERIPFLVITTGAALLLALSLTAPFMRNLLQFSAISIRLLTLSAALGILAGGWPLLSRSRASRKLKDQQIQEIESQA